MRIPLSRALIPEEAIKATEETLRTGWLGTGAKVAQFESEFADYIGIDYSIAVSSGTAALQLGLKLFDLDEGDEVITTPLTFVSTNHAILYERATPVFADVQSDTGSIDPLSIEEKISDRTKVIICVHFGGFPCDLDEIYDLASRRGLNVLEDCAHACGSVYRGKTVGSHGQVHTFSFSSVKNLATPGGGAVTVRTEEHRARLNRLRMLGADRDSYQRAKDQEYDWDYAVLEVGLRAHMNEATAAIALEQLRGLDDTNRRRKELYGHYRTRLRDVAGVTIISDKDDRESNGYMTGLLVEDRDSLITKLAAAGIESGVYYRPNYHFPMYDGHELPNVEWFWRRHIALPMHLLLTDEQVDFICDQIAGGW